MLNKTEHIKLGIHGYDSWYVIDSMDYEGMRYYMLENEYLGDTVHWVIIDQYKNIIVECAYGWYDLYDELEEEEEEDERHIY